MPKRHNEEVRERALTALALAGGSTTQAVATLRDEGIKVSRAGLSKWRQTHAERYAEIRARRVAEIDAACITHYRDLAINAAQASAEAVAKERERIRDDKVHDTAGSARNLAVTAGIASDKVAVMEGRPSTIVEHRSGEDILRRLAAQGYVVDVDSSADELPELPPPAS